MSASRKVISFPARPRNFTQIVFASPPWTPSVRAIWSLWGYQSRRSDSLSKLGGLADHWTAARPLTDSVYRLLDERRSMTTKDAIDLSPRPRSTSSICCGFVDVYTTRSRTNPQQIEGLQQTHTTSCATIHTTS